ncbi:cyclic GMP-AMP synthase-like receptor [Parasteatoda tepidariorum]|uniref:cyclic GMP-AMP synthase-like receptor n=1 Tax=Parasteatoda tepidariorum TaxID=114398 RepID=UPI00077F93DC|nr:uncharacterized protein LOC107454549 [Parasteatoda tepidariorum]
MSFVKCLNCDVCKRYFNISDEHFPEELYDLIKKYNIDQLIWLCQVCKAEKDDSPRFMNVLMGEVKNNTEELKNINDMLINMNDSIQSIQKSKTFDLRKADDYNNFDSSGFYDSGDDSGLSFLSTSLSANSGGNSSPTGSSTSTILLSTDKNSPSNNSAHKLLSKILEDIKPAEDEGKESREIVGTFMNTLIKKLKEDPEFNCLYNQPYYTGSSYNDLRITSATEYDIDIILKPPPGISLKVQFFEKTCVFAKIKWEKLKEFSEKEQYILTWFEKRSEKCSDGFYLHPGRINSWLQGKLVKCFNNFPSWEGMEKPKLVTSGPASTVKITTTTGKCIDLDLVPVFKFDYSIFSESNTPKLLREFKVTSDKEMCLFVPKPLKAGGKSPTNLSPDINSVWRLDMPEYEKAILSSKACAKCVIKLLKLMRDNMDWKGIASYYLKTLVMIKIQENPSEEYWKHTYLYERLMEALNELKKCLENKAIPCLFSRDYNLIYQLNERQCENWANKVKSHITSITSDVNSLSKILKVK